MCNVLLRYAVLLPTSIADVLLSMACLLHLVKKRLPDSLNNILGEFQVFS